MTWRLCARCLPGQISRLGCEVTFIVNQDGQVYQKDLGSNTAQLATDMVAYDPDASWQATDKATVTAQTK